MTTPSETLRRAASILRETADGATPGPWTFVGRDYGDRFDFMPLVEDAEGGDPDYTLFVHCQPIP